MTVLGRRVSGFWGVAGIGVSITLVTVWTLSPHLGGAQATSAQERAASERALARHQEALATIVAQAEGIPDLPPQMNGLVNQLSAMVQAEQRVVERSETPGARNQHAKVAAQLKRISRIVQRHLAPPPEEPDASKVQKRYDRIEARANKLLAWANDNNIEVSTDALAAAAQSAQAALATGTDQQARQAAKAYLAEVETFEEALEAAQQ